MTKRVEKGNKRETELFRVRSSQPPGRRSANQGGERRVETDEVKGECLESDPEPRERVKFGGADPLRKGAGQVAMGGKDEPMSRPPGVTDSIESVRGHGATRRREELLGDELPEYLSATTSGSGRDGSLSGMGDGIAMKRGNSRGVKAPTKQSPRKGKHQRYTAIEKN
jgi:hypothetical protein